MGHTEQSEAALEGGEMKKMWISNAAIGVIVKLYFIQKIKKRGVKYIDYLM